MMITLDSIITIDKYSCKKNIMKKLCSSHLRDCPGNRCSGNFIQLQIS